MFTVEQFVDDCLAALKERAPQSAMNELMQRSVADAGAIESALGTPSTAGVTTLHRSPDLTVLHVIWAPEMRIYPHDHAMWAVIGVYGGEEDNRFYRRTTTGLETAGGRLVDERDTIVLGEHAIHAVINPRLRFTGAIHVYGGDFFSADRREWDPETFEERPYDVERAMRTFAEANERIAARQAESR
jgi:predicted metal-dependent enzyme (double-stranded beta helix superfamily)